MSSTNRGGERIAMDVYPTPAWCVLRLLEAVDLPAGKWLEPASGDGAIIRACRTLPHPIRWTAIDIRPEARARLEPLGVEIITGDFLKLVHDAPDFAVAVTNPPFSLWIPFAQHALRMANHVVLLGRINILGSAERADWWRERPMPDIYVLPNRPSFVRGKTDSCEYAWFHWHPTCNGRTRVLRTTSKAERSG